MNRGHNKIRRSNRKLHVLELEDRCVPATLFAIDGNGLGLLRFNSANPTATTPFAINGLVSGEFLVAIDFRPATGQLFGLVVDDSSNGTIGSINLNNGTFTRIGAAFSIPGGNYGFDFNPTNDRIRITSPADINLLINPNDGAVTIQGNLNPGDPSIVGSAYSANFANATTTTLFAIDSATDQLFQQVPATGVLSPIGALGVDIDGMTGFDIAGFFNGFVAATNMNVATLHSINLTTGTMTPLGAIGSASGTFNVRGLAIARFVWDGGGSTPNWTEPANWVGDMAPEAGDDLVFPAGAAQIVTCNNDFVAGTTFNSIVFTGGGYDIDGNGISLNAGITDTSTGGNDFDLDINLAATQIFSVANAGQVLALGGVISGSSSFSLNKEKVGTPTAGTLQYDSPLGNSFQGTTSVNAGTLVLATPAGVNAVNGPLVVGDNQGGAGADIVRLQAQNVIADTSNVDVNSSGVLMLDPNFFETVNSLRVVGGLVSLGTGQLTASNPFLDKAGTLSISLLDATTSGKINGVGTVSVGGNLQLNSLSTIPTGSVIVLINNDGTDPIVGQFTGILENSTVTVNGQNFRASYVGGDGNDFTLSLFNFIIGTVFNDVNGNGMQDSSEFGLAGATIFDDADGNDAPSPGEVSTTSDASGNWTLQFSTDGPKTIRQVPPSGFVQTTPNPAVINIIGGQTIGGVVFGDFETISISGTAFNDLNKNGVQDPGEPGLAGVNILLDLGADGTPDANTFTISNGSYSFVNLGPGVYQVRQMPPINFVQTTPNPADITAVGGVNVVGIDFGNALSQLELFAVGAGVGCGPRVYVYNADNSIRFQFMAYDVSFNGEVRVATGDVNGDGVDDIITGAGPSGGPHVKVFSGTDRALLASFFAYSPSFTGGIFVGAGDIDGDGIDEVITGADAGGGPHVKVFNASNAACLQSFFAYSPAFTGGVRVAAGDVNDDGRDDIFTGAGPGGGPHVCVYSGLNNALLRSFYAYAPTFAGGVYVAAGDVNGDGTSDIITGAGSGGGPHVQAFSGENLAVLQSFFAYGSAFTGGVRVSSLDFDGDEDDDILTSPGPGMVSLIRQFRSPNSVLISEFDAFGPMFLGGAYVG